MRPQVLKKILTDSLEEAFSKEAMHVLFCWGFFLFVCLFFPVANESKGKPQDPRKQNMGSEILEAWL